MHANAARLNDLSDRIIGCAFTVLNALGAGFPEKVHENAPVDQLRKAGLATARQREITVLYDGMVDRSQRERAGLGPNTPEICLKTFREMQQRPDPPIVPQSAAA